MVFKNKREEDYLEHLDKDFGILKEHRLRLNAEKCAFGIRSGKFLVTWSLSVGLRPTRINSLPFKTSRHQRLLRKSNASQVWQLH